MLLQHNTNTPYYAWKKLNIWINGVKHKMCLISPEKAHQAASRRNNRRWTRSKSVRSELKAESLESELVTTGTTIRQWKCGQLSAREDRSSIVEKTGEFMKLYCAQSEIRIKARGNIKWNDKPWPLMYLIVRLRCTLSCLFAWGIHFTMFYNLFINLLRVAASQTVECGAEVEWYLITKCFYFFKIKIPFHSSNWVYIKNTSLLFIYKYLINFNY